MSERSEAPVPPDPLKMPMTDLEDLVNQTEPEIAETFPTEAEVEEATETEAEPVDEAPAPAEEAPPAETEVPPEKEPDALPEHVRLRLEAAEAERKKFEALAGKHAGEIGFLKQKQRELEKRLNAPRASEDEFSEQEAAQETSPKRDAKRDPLAAWAVQQSMMQAAHSFKAAHPDSEGFTEAMTKHWVDTGFDPESILLTDDPVAAGKEVYEAFNSAYLHANAADKAKKAEEAEQRRADEITKLSARRRSAAATPTGGVRAATQSKPKDPATMPMKELSQLIERVGAGEE